MLIIYFFWEKISKKGGDIMKKYIRKIAAFAIFLSLFSIVSSVPVKAEEAIEVEAR